MCFCSRHRTISQLVHYLGLIFRGHFYPSQSLNATKKIRWGRSSRNSSSFMFIGIRNDFLNATMRSAAAPLMSRMCSCWNGVHFGGHVQWMSHVAAETLHLQLEDSLLRFCSRLTDLSHRGTLRFETRDLCSQHILAFITLRSIFHFQKYCFHYKLVLKEFSCQRTVYGVDSWQKKTVWEFRFSLFQVELENQVLNHLTSDTDPPHMTMS